MESAKPAMFLEPEILLGVGRGWEVGVTGWYLTKFYTERLSPKGQPLILLSTIQTEEMPLHISTYTTSLSII